MWGEDWHLPFVGVAAQHSVFQRPVIDTVLLTVDVTAIFELGTAGGTLAMYLGLWGARLGVPVYTFDINPVSPEVERVLHRLGVWFKQEDVFGPYVNGLICAGEEPIYLICDNGDKPGEMQHYAPRIPRGSLISAHDWGDEITEADVEGLPIEPVRQDLWSYRDCRFATWRTI